MADNTLCLILWAYQDCKISPKGNTNAIYKQPA